MDGYISLSNSFALKNSESRKVLYDLRNGDNYDLTAEQYNLILLLNGHFRLADIIQLYNFDSRETVKEFIKKLSLINAVHSTKKRRFRSMIKNSVPDERLESVHLEANARCNMQCVHCYQNKYIKQKEKLEFEEIISLLDQMVKLQVNNIGISGGEPLIMPKIFDIMKAIEERNIRISAFFTNGLLANDGFIKQIKSMRSQFRIFVSLDAISEEGMIFRGLAGNEAKAALKKILSNIRKLILNGAKVVINTVVNSTNINELEKMYLLIRELKVNSWRVGFPKTTPIFKKYLKRFNVNWEITAERCLGLLEFHFRNKMPFHFQIEYLYREELFNNSSFKSLSDQDYVCDYEGRRSECCIKPNGDVVSCAYCFDLPIGNIRKSSLWDIWYSPEMKKIKKIRIGDVNECKECDLKPLCGTGCRANAFFIHSDFKNAKDDYACKAVNFFQGKVVPLLKKYNFL